MFDDRGWLKKLAIGGVMLFIPIVNFFVLGYWLRTMKQVADGKDSLLPEWDCWGDDFVRGLLVFLALLVYWLPMIAVWLASVIASAISPRAGAICSTGVCCLEVPWAIAVVLAWPAALVQYAKDSEFVAFFRFGEILRPIRDDLKGYITVILLMIVASTVASTASVVFLPAMFWAALVYAHLLGQLKAQSMAVAGVPTPGTSHSELTLGDLSTPKEDQPPSEA